MSQRNYSFDSLKCLLAFFVVCIHSPLVFGTHLKPLFCVAVPLFLMISGWFLHDMLPDIKAG
ncbi:acyltransferase family protein [Palleniella intestinalis]|uniref:acyltransferase family protein n=1 Tax=Palleniella intestinalis TaxID=2736291 RepID=UPI00350F18B4